MQEHGERRSLKYGLYEQVVSRLLDRCLSGLDEASTSIEVEALDEGDSHCVLAEYMQQVIRSTLAGVRGEERLARQVGLCNQIVDVLAQSGSATGVEEAAVVTGARRLLAVMQKSPIEALPPERPDTPLSIGCLLTGTRLDPSLISQLRKEIRSASQIDILCSFIKWSGVRILEDDQHRMAIAASAAGKVTAQAGEAGRRLTFLYATASALVDGALYGWSCICCSSTACAVGAAARKGTLAPA